MDSKKEEKLLDDIDERTEELQSRMSAFERTLLLLPAWMNKNISRIDGLFATAEQLKSWVENGHYDEVDYFHAVNSMLDALRPLHNIIDYNRRILYGDIGDEKRAARILSRIEKEEIALSEEEKGEAREGTLQELARIQDAEKKFNMIIGSLRLFTFKLREIEEDARHEIGLLEGYLKHKKINELKEATRMGKIERDIDFIRTIIVPGEGNVQNNAHQIDSTLQTLRAHTRALKRGAKFVTMPAA
jgi:hypothetical protein